MTGTTRRVRALLGVRARRVILGVMPAGVAYLIEMVVGWHPQAGLIVAQALGYWFAYAVRRVVVKVTRRGTAAPGGDSGEPACRVLATPEPEIVILVQQGRKIRAIKRYREQNPGTGLKEAKHVIDGLVDQSQVVSLAGRNRALVIVTRRAIG